MKIDKKARVAILFGIVLAIGLIALSVNAAQKKCNNGIDDDNDGLIDLADVGCSGAGDNAETDTALVCDNGADATNDRDTLADFRLSGGDPGCLSVTDSSEVDGVCDDSVDSSADRDTLSDATDPGCTSFSDTSEVDGECDDSIDSTLDKDTLSDATDPGCTSFSDTSEISGQCDDLSDNDGDGYTDYSTDSKCTGYTDNDESPRDFCSDTDFGINSLSVGTISGDDESVAFSNTDYCVDGTTLNEYYCGSLINDYAPLSTNVNCATNTTTSCVSGACV